MRIKLDQLLDDFFYAIKYTLLIILTYYRLLIFFIVFALVIKTLLTGWEITDSRFMFDFCLILCYLPLILVYKILDKKYPDYKELDIEKRKNGKDFKHWWQL